jgi:hypothetical protein
MIQILKDGTPADQVWTQIGTATAELDNEQIERFDLRKPLEAFAAALLEQMDESVTRDGNPLVGIQITGIDFQRIFGYSDYDKKRFSK